MFVTGKNREETRMTQILILIKTRTLLIFPIMRFDWPEVKDANVDGKGGAQILQEIKKNWEIQLWGGKKDTTKKRKAKNIFKGIRFNFDRWKICCHSISWMEDKEKMEVRKSSWGRCQNFIKKSDFCFSKKFNIYTKILTNIPSPLTYSEQLEQYYRVK